MSGRYSCTTSWEGEPRCTIPIKAEYLDSLYNQFDILPLEVVNRAIKDTFHIYFNTLEVTKNHT